MANLSTEYLGLILKNPLVVSASPLSKKVDTVRRLEEVGAAAVVVYSLFEEQIMREGQALDQFLLRSTETGAEAAGYFPQMDTYNMGAEGYLTHIERLKKAVQIPIIGSLNGISSGGWVDYAHKIEQAGADALELNLYYLPTHTSLSAAELEDAYIELVRQIRARIRIPLAVKLGPQFTAIPNFAKRIADAGANGLVLFNRFYQPDLDVETLEVVPNLQLSTSADLRLPLRWVAILYGRVPIDLALTSGVHTNLDVVKAIMAGASVAMLASELIANGVNRLAQLESELRAWLEIYEYESIAQMKGSMSQKNVAEPAAFERANYMKILASFDTKTW